MFFDGAICKRFQKNHIKKSTSVMTLYPYINLNFPLAKWPKVIFVLFEMIFDYCCTYNWINK